MGEYELKNDVREMTGYLDGSVLSDSALDTAYRNAKRHLRVAAGLEARTDWFDPTEPKREEALYWWTCLFTKVATGELDSQDLQIGAVDTKSLLAADDDTLTQWYQNAESAKRALTSETAFGHRSETIRDGRTYDGSGDDSSSGLSTNI